MPGQPRPHRHCVARMLDAGLQPPRAIVCQRKCPMALHHELVARTHLQRQSTEFARFAGELVVRVLPGEPTQRYEHVLCEFMREAQARAGLVMPHLPHSDMAKDGMRRDTVSPRSRRRNAFESGSHAGATPSESGSHTGAVPAPGQACSGAIRAAMRGAIWAASAGASAAHTSNRLLQTDVGCWTSCNDTVSFSRSPMRRNEPSAT